MQKVAGDFQRFPRTFFFHNLLNYLIRSFLQATATRGGLFRRVKIIVNQNFASLAYCNYRYLSHILHFIHIKSPFQEQFPFPIEIFRSLVLPRTVIMLQQIIIQFLLHYL